MGNDNISELKTKKAVVSGMNKTTWALYRFFSIAGNVLFVIMFILTIFILGHDKDMSFFSYMGALWARSKFTFFGVIFLSLIPALIVRGIFGFIASLFAKAYGALKSPDAYDDRIKTAENEQFIKKRTVKYKSVEEEMEAFKLSSNYFAG